jgi:hypothetical protein
MYAYRVYTVAMSFKVVARRAAGAAAVPAGAAMAMVAGAEHAPEWSRGAVNPPARLAADAEEYAPDVILGALAGAAASLVGNKAVELTANAFGWVTAPRNVEVRARRIRMVRASRVGRGVTMVLSTAAGAATGLGRGVDSVIAGGLGGAGTGTIFTRRR